ncbi:isocitrate/isopropylmalate family dehydrogenase [Candidatus Uabimicrobium sp. HlEnr_7]|uniref:isocitrate/isopropylmalate family dehydrogenase n=1 Tax=Candidatus Uabimicrobium helgolandensis TaxID=3095367 RepID=UPI00355661D9
MQPQRFSQSIYTDNKSPENYSIGVLKGEGVGSHIIDCSLKLLLYLPQNFDISYGGAIGKLSEKECGESLTKEVIDFCQNVFSKEGAILAGPGGSRFVYELRREFDLFCKVVPLKFYPEIYHANRLKENFAAGTSITLLRENASGIYQGQESLDRSKKDEVWQMTFSYKKSEVEKILTVAAKIAQNSRKKMLVIVKDGGLCEFSKFWRKIAQQTAEEYHVECEFANIDYATYYMIHYAQSLDVIVASNLFGDILADLGSVIMGGRGISFSGNFSQHKAAVYQTNHGSAYDLQGQNKANPVGQFYSLAMLLRESFHLDKEAFFIEEAVRRSWEQGTWTFDVAPHDSSFVTTDKMTESVSRNLQKIVEEHK